MESPGSLCAELEPTKLRFSLAAAMDVALFSVTEGAGLDCLRNLDSSHVRTAQRLLTAKHSYRSSAPFAHQTFEAFPIRSFEDLQSNEWVLFRARFAQSASDGKKGNVFHGVSSVLAEMADNVVCHAGVSRNGTCRGLAAYHITARCASFSVVDNGRAFLASLRTNPRWNTLGSEQEALRAVLLQHATSRVEETAGGGFTVLYNKLISFNGMVMLRSGDCRATIQNTSAPTNTLILRLARRSPGAQVTVIISKKGDPAEEILEESS